MTIRTIIGSTIAALIGGVIVLGWVLPMLTTGTSAQSEATTQGPSIRSEFDLVDQNGKIVRGEDMRGRWQLVFFGFTTCPDICPTTLTNVSTALEELGPALTKDLQPLLITVDPERDTPMILKDYLTSFDPRVVGLTGTPEQIKAALRSFAVYASKRPLAGDEYTMDHSAFIYLMNPKGEYVTHFGYSTPTEEMIGKLREQLGDRGS